MSQGSLPASYKMLHFLFWSASGDVPIAPVRGVLDRGTAISRDVMASAIVSSEDTPSGDVLGTVTAAPGLFSRVSRPQQLQHHLPPQPPLQGTPCAAEDWPTLWRHSPPEGIVARANIRLHSWCRGLGRRETSNNQELPSTGCPTRHICGLHFTEHPFLNIHVTVQNNGATIRRIRRPAEELV